MRRTIQAVLLATSLALPGGLAWAAGAKAAAKETKAEAKPEAKPEEKPAETKPAETKPAETKLDVQPATGSDGKTDTKTEKKEETKEESKTFDLHADGGLYDAADQSRKMALSFMLNVPTWATAGYFGAGVGFGFRFTYPLISNGFVNKLNDSFELEFNGDFFDNLTYIATFVGFDLAVGARYTLHFTPKIDAYFRVALGFQYAAYNFWRGGDFLFYDFGPGAEYKVLDFLLLRAEITWTGFHLGAAYIF